MGRPLYLEETRLSYCCLHGNLRMQIEDERNEACGRQNYTKMHDLPVMAGEAM